MAKKWKIILFDPKIGYSILEKNLTEEEARKEVDSLRKSKMPAFMHLQNMPLFSKRIKKVI